MSGTLQAVLGEKRVLVVCGAGGVGKTTTAASLALAAARGGRRVLVITIDPSKRLAQTLGVSAHAGEPSPLETERQRAVGIAAPGELSAWMLDPQAVSDRTVRRLAKDPAAADLLLGNRIYRHVTSMVAGMQEYTAIEALHEYVADDRYDLVVLDTPPSRNALRFLDAPSRANAFLDRRILRLFVPEKQSRVRRTVTNLVESMLDLGFGASARKELQQFLLLFEQVLQYLNRNQREMRGFFASDDVAFLLVSSPRPEALEEAYYFEEQTRELTLPLAGYLLNRSRAFAAGRPMPSEVALPDDASATLRNALAKLEALAHDDAASARAHEALRRKLAARVPAGFGHALPELPGGASDLASLVAIAEILEAPA